MPSQSLAGLLDCYLKEGESGGRPSSTRKRWTPVFNDLRKHLGHDDATGPKAEHLRGWLDARAGTLAPKILKDVHFAACRNEMGVYEPHIQLTPTLEVASRKAKR